MSERADLRLPRGITPRLLSREAAAEHLGLSVRQFDIENYPSILIGGERLWDRHRLHRRGDTRGEASGCVYFLEAPPLTPIKIGFVGPESTLQARLAGLQTGCPYRLRSLVAVPGSFDLELDTHRLFAADRLVGEWFERSDRLMRLIADLQRGTELRAALKAIRNG